MPDSELSLLLSLLHRLASPSSVATRHSSCEHGSALAAPSVQLCGDDMAIRLQASQNQGVRLRDYPDTHAGGGEERDGALQGAASSTDA